MIYSQYQLYKKKALLMPTPADIEGPFYKAGAPFRSKLGIVGSPVHLSGRVLDVDGNPLLDAVLDFWQADAAGVYDNTGFDYRGKVKVDAAGAYTLDTIRPGDYQIDVNEFRCSHIHVKVSAPGYKLLTTQLYFLVDPYNATDHWFDVRRVIAEPIGVFDFVLEKGASEVVP